MPLQFSAAHSSRIKKPSTKNPVFKRSASSPFQAFNQRKPIQRSQSKPEVIDDDEDFFGDRLDDIGLVTTLATDLSLRDVAQTVRYIRTHMFDALPEKGGFNSTRTAEILNFRKSLPLTVTVSHVHAFIQSPTRVEREIVELTKAGVIRKFVVPGRGVGGSSVGEGLVLVEEYERLLRETDGLDDCMIDKFIAYFKANPLATTLPRAELTDSETISLMRSGFLTSSQQPSQSANILSGADVLSSRTLSSIANISKAASGSMAAIGGEGAIHEAGGSGKGIGIRRSSSQAVPLSGSDLQLALPNTGPYLQLLTGARSHLMSIVMKSRFKELPLYLLKERWDGGISADDPAAKAKKYRGEFAGVLPARARKWKQFHGLGFHWVLAECLGAGLIELFETGSVGRGVRVT